MQLSPNASQRCSALVIFFALLAVSTMAVWENTATKTPSQNTMHWGIFWLGITLSSLSIAYLWMIGLGYVTGLLEPKLSQKLLSWFVGALTGLAIVVWELRLASDFAFIHR